MANDNLNIMFKRGTQQRFDTLTSFAEGTFYLTTDTNRLYVGKSDSTAALLNQTVQIVANVDALSNLSHKKENDFYYCTDENVLAVYHDGKWVQINPDTDTNNDTQVTSGSISSGVLNNETIKYTVTLNQKTKDKDGKDLENQPSPITFDLTLTKEELESIIHDPASVGLNTTQGDNAATIKTTGEGSDDTKFAVIKGGNNVTIAVNEGNIEISAKDTNYNLSTLASGEEAIARLTNSEQIGCGDAKFKAGKNLTVTANTDGITFAHEEITTTAETEDVVKLEAESEIEIIAGATINNGHLTSITTKKYQLPKDTNTRIESISETGTSWQRVISDTDERNFTIDFSSEANDLKEDLEKTIEEGLAAANTALTYKGVIDAYEGLSNLTNVEIGDVYMLSAKDGDYEKGDLFIAIPGEDATVDNGVISGTITWTYIPSGDDLNTDTLFYGDVTVDVGSESGGKVTYALKAKRGADEIVPEMPEGNENLIISGGQDILISADNTVDNNTVAVVGHKLYNALSKNISQTADLDRFEAITGINLSNGHITEITSTEFKVPEYVLSGANNKIILTKTYKNGQKSENIVSFGGDDTWIDVNTVEESGNKKIEFSHMDVDTSSLTTVGEKPSGKVNLTPKGEFDVISKVSYDGKGHVSEVETATVVLPQDTTYEIFMSNETGVKLTSATSDAYLALNDIDEKQTKIQLKGDGGSLNVTATSNSVEFGLVWGSF